MTLASGSKLGPYEIVSPLGAGGMGEVYRARDPRLGREVAIKVLPSRLSSDPDRLRRFEKEARSSSSLNHPNVVTVFDIGDDDGTAYMAMELVDGRTLRELLAEGALPVRRLLGIAAQIADGLARAHGAGIVHRDLKPENVMVRRDGFVKILDFGLAKLTQSDAPQGDQTRSPTMTAGTEAGVVMGTAGYMSPEQALGKPLDFRSDQFALGAILYEMATGRRAFERPSAPETLAAIIRDEPEPLRQAAPSTPIPLVWCAERCLAKDPEDRYGSTRDLAQDLARLRDGVAEGSLSSVGIAAAEAAPRWAPWRMPALVAAAVLAGAAVAVVATRRPREKVPEYRPVSFHRGSIGGARFAPDEKTIVYAAAWQGGPPRLYSTRLDSAESTELPLPSANLLSISSAGKLAILLGLGTENFSIAEVSLAGGAPRPLFESERQILQFTHTTADWQPGQDRLAIVRNGQLEFPPGKVLVAGAAGAQVVDARFSPDGTRLAFIQVAARDNQAVGVVDLTGEKKILSSGWEIVQSLAWHPGTGEIWFSGRNVATGMGVIELHAVSLSGAQRIVARSPQLIIVQDIARDGRVLARGEEWTGSLMCLPPGGSRELDLTWLDFANGLALSADGQDLLFIEGGAGTGAAGGTYMRKTDGVSPAVRLGDGFTDEDLSADKKWVLQRWPEKLVLLPVGPGEPRTIQDPGFAYRDAAFLPDGRGLVIAAAAAGRRPSLYVRDLAAGPPRPFGPEGCGAPHASPNGRSVAAVCGGKWFLIPLAGGEPRALAGLGEKPDEVVIGFDDTGRDLWIGSGARTVRIERYEIATGKRSFFKDITVADPTGVEDIDSVQLTPDGRAYCYSFTRSLSRLFVVDGLR